jgi:hypothetical protein
MLKIGGSNGMIGGREAPSNHKLRAHQFLIYEMPVFLIVVLRAQF